MANIVQPAIGAGTNQRHVYLLLPDLRNTDNIVDPMPTRNLGWQSFSINADTRRVPRVRVGRYRSDLPRAVSMEPCKGLIVRFQNRRFGAKFRRVVRKSGPQYSITL